MNNYPTEEQLKQIEIWRGDDFHGLMKFIKPIWMYSDCGYWKQEKSEYHISTGGWSGNEEIIDSMQKNYIWWTMFWKQSTRGGHYIFKDTKDYKTDLQARLLEETEKFE